MEQNIKQIGHLKAPGNWMNDPNGFIYYKGKYHLFYQYFPYGTVWGTMHWGHAISDDLVNWEHQGIALFPTKYGDQNGCFSGSAVEYEGKMVLFYTGVHYYEANPENIHVCLHDRFDSCQMRMVSEDGVHFDNWKDKQVVILPMEDNGHGHRTDTRDPKVWKGKNGWMMVLGSRSEDRKGKLLFYQSPDLKNWSYINEASKGDGWGWMWECPDYFETEGGQVVVFSPMGFLKDGKGEENQAICMVVDFQEDGCEMNMPDQYQYLDYGFDLYAPQSTMDEEGRRVLVAWLRMPKAVKEEGQVPWKGMFSLPRVVEVKDGHVYFRVHPNVKKLYSRPVKDVKDTGLEGYHLSLQLEDGGCVNVGGYRIFRRGSRIGTDRTDVFCKGEDYRTVFETPKIKEGFQLDIYVEEHMVEVYINDGEYVVSNGVYGLKKELFISGGSMVKLFGVTDLSALL
ncbi:glycoside hydrolase family 32 protein [Candidatus Ventrimonas sp. KK005]|nr:glycoside hydrolase family 32 protein [Lachnospiraceae bacterium]NBH19613.1 glycoside hydrolase family 32 protein [Clostridiaceae bacterium]